MKYFKAWSFLLCCLYIIFWHSLIADADILSSVFAAYVSVADVNALVQAIGTGMDYRAYEPATLLGKSFSIGLEATLVEPPKALGIALGDLISPGSGSVVSIPIEPSMRIHIHKGFGSSVDLGISMFPPISSIPYIGSSFMLGGDIKMIVYNPEEGPAWSIRISYNYNNFVMGYSGQSFSINTSTISPGFIVSKKLSFADPYLGANLQIATGSVQTSVNLPVIGSQLLSQSGNAMGLDFFCGIQMTMPETGFQLDIEGDYSYFGMNSIGTKIGFAF